MKNVVLFLLFILCAVFSINNAYAQKPAFPGAEGFGKFTQGGRGGKVLIVDKISDQLQNPETGTLRWAVNKDGPRVIIFAVSGTIALEAPLKIKQGHITIAGQTAPGDGICLKNFVVNIEADQVIIRYLRFRCGIERAISDSQDGINGKKHSDIILDHCSVSWSIDEAASFYDNKNFTMQWCIVSESLYNAGHSKEGHGYGGIWGGMGASFHHNLLASNTSRNPRFCGARYHGNESAHELVDVRNNVIFNWGFNTMYGGEGGWQNIVGNYFKSGPATRKHKDRILNPDGSNSRWFVNDNFVEGFPEISADNWRGGVQDADTIFSVIRSEKEFPFAGLPGESAQEAYEKVLRCAGANFPKRDLIDARIVEEVKSGVCKFGDTWGSGTGIIDSQQSVGGWPFLKTYNQLPDTDKDGMPDVWEKKHKLNPKDPTDGAVDTDENGVNNFEEYLNSLGTSNQ